MKVRVVNWFLTRRCNLKCKYCRISRDYDGIPYAPMSSYINCEMSTDFIEDVLLRLKRYNKNIFHCFLGGEPFLRDDMAEIINFCNDEDIEYTITTNCTMEKKIEKFFNDIDYIKSFTASVDPIIMSSDNKYDKSISIKSNIGIKTLLKYQKTGKILDVVADVVIDNNNVIYLFELLSFLKEHNITAHVGIVTKAMNEFYDLSSSDERIQLLQFDTAKPIFDKIIKSDLDNYLFGDIYLEKVLENLPCNVDCEIEKALHNISIDSNGQLRLCAMIKGLEMPKLNIKDVIDINGKLNENVYNYLKKDKKLCKKCMDMCLLLSKLIDQEVLSEKSAANK